MNGLSGPATAAHIHVGAMGVAGPPVYKFTVEKVTNGTVAQGTIDLTKNVSMGVSGDSLKVLLANGNAYVNVHTAAHGDGEIRMAGDEAIGRRRIHTGSSRAVRREGLTMNAHCLPAVALIAAAVDVFYPPIDFAGGAVGLAIRIV